MVQLDQEIADMKIEDNEIQKLHILPDEITSVKPTKENCTDIYKQIRLYLTE